MIVVVVVGIILYLFSASMCWLLSFSLEIIILLLLLSSLLPSIQFVWPRLHNDCRDYFTIHTYNTVCGDSSIV